MSKWLNWKADKDYLRKMFDKSIDIYGTVKILTVLDHVSASGMTHVVSAYINIIQEGKPVMITIAKEVSVGGCGMDMGFNLAYNMFCSVYGCSNPERPYQKYLDQSWL